MTFATKNLKAHCDVAREPLWQYIKGKAVNREDKRSRRYRDRHFAKFERSRCYRDRYHCPGKKSRRGLDRDLVFRDPPPAENESSIANR